MKLKRFNFYTASLVTLLLLYPVISHSANPASLNSLFIVDCKAEQDYGLHSYYLFYEQPVFDDHIAALKQTEFLLRKITKIKKLYAGTSTNTQQTFYIPVSFKPQSWVLQPAEDDFAAAARWVLHNYDYQCAQKLLQPFSGLVGGGPYFLSSLEKLKIKSNPDIPWRSPVLIQNLSGSDPRQSLFWLTTFFKKSWQPRQWHITDLSNLRDSLIEGLNNYDIQLKRPVNSANNNLRSNKPIESKPNPLTINDPARSQNDSSQAASTLNPIDSFSPLSAPPTKFNYFQKYPVNERLPSQLNPYENKITIQFRREKKNNLLNNPIYEQ